MGQYCKLGIVYKIFWFLNYHWDQGENCKMVLSALHCAFNVPMLCCKRLGWYLYYSCIQFQWLFIEVSESFKFYVN